MTPESMIVAALTFFLALLAAWALLLPYLGQAPARGVGSEGAEEREALEIRRETALTALEELEEDHVTMRISEREYQQSRAQLAAEAVEAQQTLDALDRRETAAASTVPLSRSRNKSR